MSQQTMLSKQKFAHRSGHAHIRMRVGVDNMLCQQKLDESAKNAWWCLNKRCWVSKSLLT